MRTALSTGVVLLTWAVVGVLVWGCGYAVRRFVTRLVGLRDRAAPCLADVWTGLGAVTVHLLLWSLVAPIDAMTWLPMIALAALGWALAFRSRVRPSAAPPLAWTLLVVVLVVWLANASLGDTTAYDSGLYHFAAIDLASDGSVVPGLGNLHIRLSSAAGHLLFVALLGVGPWRGAGQHLANGFLLALLFLQLGAAVAAGRRQGWALSSRVALLLVPAVVLIVAADPMGRVSSPSLDIAALVGVVAGGVLLARAVELSHDVRYLVAAGGAFGAALATRPQVAPAVIAGLGLLVLRVDWSTATTRALAFGLLPLASLLGSALRQTMLSGYPLFPLSWPRFDVDWSLEPRAVDAYREVVESWARRPGDVTGAALDRWGWLGHWSRVLVTDLDLALVVLLLLLVPILLLLRPPGGARRPRGERAVIVALLAPAAAMVALWFPTAPDTRFAYGAILLLCLGAVACLLPAPSRHRVAPLLIVLVLWGAVAFTFARNGLGLVEARGGGPFRSFETFPPATRPFVTDSGLVLQTPLEGDRCWEVQLCTPEPQHGLELRGADPHEGFRLAPG